MNGDIDKLAYVNGAFICVNQKLGIVSWFLLHIAKSANAAAMLSSQ